MAAVTIPAMVSLIGGCGDWRGTGSGYELKCYVTAESAVWRSEAVGALAVADTACLSTEQSVCVKTLRGEVVAATTRPGSVSDFDAC